MPIATIECSVCNSVEKGKAKCLRSGWSESEYGWVCPACLETDLDGYSSGNLMDFATDLLEKANVRKNSSG